ncbi:hypothetical protein [Streptomyces microflavus]|uniref:hypothetical protein n=1 Tax=Streptomyces microflavus TaxID=1919 RepID=UPI00367B8793
MPEQWTTVHIARLRPGDVFRFPGEHVDSVVTAVLDAYDDEHGRWFPFSSKELATGRAQGRSVYLANTSVLFRAARQEGA